MHLLLSTIKVETNLIDPTILELKSDAELRDFLSALRQKECDERVNVNFAPYCSQRAIAESRLRNVQSKIRQLEAEFDRRRCATLPAPTLSTRIIQQFSDPCYSVRLEDPRRLFTCTLPPDVSPDAFTAKLRSPKRLLLKKSRSTGNPETATQTTPPAIYDTRVEKSTGSGVGQSTTERPTETDRDRSSTEIRIDKTMSKESVGGAKKKLRTKIEEISETTVECKYVKEEIREDMSSAKLTLDVYINVILQRCRAVSSQKQERTSWERTSHENDVKCWLTKAYVNVADYKSTRTLMESGNDTITLSEKIDARDVCKSSDVIVTPSPARITNREESGKSASLRQSEKQAVVEITISGKEIEEAIEEDDVPTESSRSTTPTKAAQEETKATIPTEISNGDQILSAQEMEQMSPIKMYTSSLQVTLKWEEKEYGGGQKNGNAKILLLSATGAIKRSANEPSTSRGWKKIRFQLILLLTNIVYDKDREYQRKRKIDGKIATKGKKINVVKSDIEKLHEYSSMYNLLKHAIARDIIERDHAKNAVSERPDFSKFRVDRQCQTESDAVKADSKTPITLLKANIFPLLKQLLKSTAGNSSIYHRLNYL